MQTIVVTMGEIKTARGEAALETFGVGSCVAIVLADPEAHIAGMAHVMLTKEKASAMQCAAHPFRYVEHAIPALIDGVIRAGAHRSRLIAHIFGGAQMFSSYRDPSNAIGPHNVSAAKKVLEESHIPLVTNDTGGKQGRNVLFEVQSGVCTVRTKG